MDPILIIGTLAFMAIYFFLLRLYETRRAPPGPWGLPFIGLLITLNKGNALLKIREYTRKYGKIISFRIGSYDAVVISDYKLIQEALKREEFLGRPDFESWKARNGGFKNRGVLFSDGDRSWQDLRRFTLKNLREFGIGKQSMEGMLLHETDELVKKLKNNLGKAISVKNNFNCSVFNSLWAITSGDRFDLEDERFHKILNLFAGFIEDLKIFSPAQVFPWPAMYGLMKRDLWKKFLTMRDTLSEYLNAVIKEHVDTYNEGVTRDLIDAYLHHHKVAAIDSCFYSEEGINNLRITLMDLFAAGTETSGTTLLWACLFLGKHPDVQRKLHVELDQVIQRRSVTREDRIRLPYLEAFISEVHRCSSIVPMSVYHKITRDCEFGGYFMRKGTNVYLNLYEVHHDNELWGDPENFRPERFLNEAGDKFVTKEALMPFSTGKRICLGETLARDTLYYFMAGILQNFVIELFSSSGDQDLVAPKSNFIRSPYDFKVILHER